VVSIVSILWLGFNLGIDFTGGVLMEVKSAQVIDIGAMRGDIIGLGYNDPVVQTFGGGECDRPAGSCASIRVQPREVAGVDQNDADQAVVREIKAKLGTGYQYRRTEVVGPKVGQELIRAGVLATVLALLAIAAYVWFRFEWQFGVSALISLVHDVVTTLGLFSLFQLEFNLPTLAAVLTIAGYSINGGALTQVPGSPFPAGSGPSSVTASRNAVYVANLLSSDISVYQIGPGGSLLSAGFSVPTGGGPPSVAVDP